MTRLTRRRHHIGNTDSFLDVLTCTVGVLVFVLLFVALAAADATILVRTPLHEPSSKDAIFFEVLGDRVAHVDTKRGNEQFRDFMRSLPTFSLWNYERVIRSIHRWESSSANHRVSFVGDFAGSYGLRYRLRDDGAGESIFQIRAKDSEFRRLLAAADADEQFVAFLVHPDGTAAFRDARKIAMSSHFQTGWEPLTSDVVFVLKGSGREVGVQ